MPRATVLQPSELRRALLLTAAAALTCCLMLSGCSSASANPGIPHDPPSAREIVERYVEAVGGRDAVAALRTRVSEMHLVTDLEWDPPVHEVDTLSVYGTAAGDFLVVTRTPKGVILEGRDGGEDWRIDTDGRVEGRHPKGPRDMWMTDPQFPIKMHAYFPDMRSTGVETWGDDWVYVVEIDDDESHRLGFDVETGLLVRVGYNRELRDYEEVDGVLVPRRIAYSRKGGSSTYVFDAISHNEKLDRSIFSLAK